jgi:hypothetical protein
MVLANPNHFGIRPSPYPKFDGVSVGGLNEAVQAATAL